MKNLLVILISLSLSVKVFGQITNTGQANSYFQSINNVGEPDIKGSPLLVNEWVSGSIETIDGESFNDILLIYNVADHEILYKRIDGKIYKIKDSAVESFKLVSSNKIYSFVRLDNINNSSDKTIFLEIISKGRINLYKKHNIAVIDSKGYGAQNVNILLNPTTSLYYEKDGNFKKLNNKTDIIKIVPKKKEEIQSYIKEEKIDIDKEMDLKKLFAYLNHLEN